MVKFINATGNPRESFVWAFIAAISCFTLVRDAHADSWESRSTANGVVMATRFDTEGEVSDYAFSQVDHVSWDQSRKASGGGSLRMDILKTDGAAAGSWTRHLRDDHGDFKEGDRFYVQYRQYVPRSLRDQAFKGNNNGYANGWKSSIISNVHGSNQNFEVVIENTYHRGYIQGYNRNTTGQYLGWQVSKSTPCGSPDFVFQNMIDHGGVVESCEDARRRYGGSTYGYPSQTGAPDPETGAFIWYPDEWITLLQEVTVGSFGAGNDVRDSRIRVWAARESDTEYTLLIDRDINLGLDRHRTTNEQIYFNGLWLLPYNTGRVGDSSRANTFTCYDEVIVSTQFIEAPSAGDGGGGDPDPEDTVPPAPPRSVQVR